MARQLKTRTKIILLISIILSIMLLTLFKKQSKEEKFWRWVSKNKVELEAFINSKNSDYTIYNQLTKEIRKYNSSLSPEMALTENDEIVLIITANGLSEGIIPTQTLFDAKPELDNWVVKKFRQPKDSIQLNFNGIEFPCSDIEIFPEIDKEKDKINIQVFIRNMNLDEKKYQSLAWLYLDHILGEFNTIKYIGYVDFYNLEQGKSVEQSISILELRKLIEREIYDVEFN